MTVKAVFFDVDGTLVDSNDFHVDAWEEVFRAGGVEVTRQAIHDQIGKGADMLVPALVPGADDTMSERLGSAHGEVFKRRYLDLIGPFAGAHDLLARVHRAGQAVVLASSAAKDELRHYLDLLDAHHVVTATTSADDVASTKPAPDIFAVALKKVAPISPDEVIVLGDSPYDVEGAGKCGIRAVALRSGGFGDDALRRAGAVALYDDVADLLAGYDASPLAKS